MFVFMGNIFGSVQEMEDSSWVSRIYYQVISPGLVSMKGIRDAEAESPMPMSLKAASQEAKHRKDSSEMSQARP